MPLPKKTKYEEGQAIMRGTESTVSWLHRLGSLVAVMTFLMLMTGALAANADSSAGISPWAGLASSDSQAAKYVRILGGFELAVATLTVVFVLWLLKSPSPRYIKTLGNISIVVLFATILANLNTVRRVMPTAAFAASAVGIQIFFCLTVCLALFTRTDWRWDEPKTPDLASPSVRQVLIFTTAAIFVQPFLGEGFRRKGTGIAPHLVLGIAVAVCSLWVMEMVLTKFSQLREFKISAIFLGETVGLQLFLGLIDYSMILNARAVPGVQPGLTVMNVTHAAVGTLVLATSLFVTFQAFKYLAPAGSRVPATLFPEYQERKPLED